MSYYENLEAGQQYPIYLRFYGLKKLTLFSQMQKITKS